MKILAIESTCDETAAALVEPCGGGVRVLTNIIASSASIHQKYGGVVPEVAAREQLASIIPVISEALKGDLDSVDSIAVSYGPGLMGSLLIGVESAKALSWAWKKPLLKVNHMAGHILANWIITSETDDVPIFPAMGLVVSGGHTDIILLKDFNNWEWVGGTRDDALGEAFDKTARILGLPYPGGQEMDKAAQRADVEKWISLDKKFRLPRPMIFEKGLDMSFSGIKAAMSRIVETYSPFDQNMKDLMAKEFSEAVTEVLIKKTLLAIERFAPKSVLLGGGVAANLSLRERLKYEVTKVDNIKFFVPEMKYCGDNAAMIGAAAILRPVKTDKNLKPDPSLMTV